MPGVGGRRKGAGRPPGAKDTMKRQPPTEKAVKSDRTIGTVKDGDEPLSVRFLRAVVENPNAPDNLRLRAAESLLELEKPETGTAGSSEPVGKKAEALKAAADVATGRLGVPQGPIRKVVDNS